MFHSDPIFSIARRHGDPYCEGTGRPACVDIDIPQWGDILYFMKYFICAKIVGTFLPAKAVRIHDCKISKGYSSDHTPYDTPIIPVKDVGLSQHSISHGVLNFIHYPQRPLSVRTFESEYTISTEIDAHDVRRAQEEAILKFEEVIATLSFALKTTVRNTGVKRLRRDDEHYDFEIVAAYIKQKKQFVRVKLPQPSTNGHNFFPKAPPKGFIAKTKKILDSHDSTFWKALLYLHKVDKLQDTGNFDELRVTLNFVKCIELISKSVILSRTNAQKKPLYMKERILLAGKKLGVTKKNILNAQQAWDARNDADIAHAKAHSWGAWPNFSQNQSASNEFLLKYYKYITKNPPPYYIGTGRNWRNLI